MLLRGRSPWALAWFALAAQNAAGSSHAEEESLNGPIAMPNLGRGFSLGALYDARTDQRVGGFLWPINVLKDKKYVKELNAKKAKYSMVYDDSIKDKAQLLEVSSELALSSRSSSHGIGSKSNAQSSLSGSAEFMSQTRSSTREVRMSVAYKLRSYQQVLDVFHPDIKNALHDKVVADKRATHVVASVTYGSNCIATFTYTAKTLKERTTARAFLETKMSAMGEASLPFNMGGAQAQTSLETEVSAKFDNMQFSTSSGISVDILGDVVPFANETLPTSVEEGVAFMKKLHQHGIGDGGVPMDLTLVPISWLDSAAAKLARKLDSNTIDEAFKIVMELDTSVESLNELLDIDSDGFLAWEAAMGDQIKVVESFRANVTQDISEAMDLFRDGGDISLLTAVFNAYYASDFTLQSVQVIAEQKRDEIVNLKAMVSSLKKQAAVATAEYFSDYMAPSLDQSYDNVYILLLTGMNPAKFRSSLGLVKDFTAYAASFLTSRSPTTWCRVASLRGQDTCVERFYFGAIHFDSFCEQFCPSQYCKPTPRECTDPAASAAFSFNASDRNGWCSNPCTMILGFKGSLGPYRADTLVEVLPSAPTIVSVTGADDVQSDPYRQKVMLHVTPGQRGSVTNWRIRTSWLERVESGGDSVWTQKQSLFDTMEDSTDIPVRRLVAGRKYTFEVAGINLVGVGPFSDEYRQSDGRLLKIARTMVTISSEEGFSVPRNNSGPGWKPWRIRALLSVPAEEPLGTITFQSYGGGSSFECEEYRDATTSEVTCLVPGPFTMFEDEFYEVVVKNMEGDEVQGHGNFTLEAHSGDSCFNTETEARVFCNATKMCVRSCSECMEIDVDAQGQIKKTNTTEVFQTHTCLYDVCPDVGGSPSTFCPNTATPFPCFLGQNTDDCRRNCHLTSVYYAPSGLCSLPCKVDLSPAGLAQACTTVVPGETCSIGCKTGWVITSGNRQPVPFLCPEDNTVENYLSTHPAVSAPTCAATCSIFSCPPGWASNPSYDARVSDAKENCCDEGECNAGHYGPALTPACQTCNGETRRRRATSCTACQTGHVAKVDHDDCIPYCSTISCLGGWAEKPNKDTLGGTKNEDCCVPWCSTQTCPTGWRDRASKNTRVGSDIYSHCCDEITCNAGYWRNGNTCQHCSGTTRRRRATSCTGCPGGYVNVNNQDDCKPYCSTISCPSGWWEKSNKHTRTGSHYTHCCDEVTCPGGYYTRRRAASCDTCNGATRRRRATSCTGCPRNYRDNGNNDDCTKNTATSGYAMQGGDCTGGDMSGESHSNRDLSWCAGRCNGLQSWWNRCHGFSFYWSGNQCIMKTSSCRQNGAYNLNGWMFFKRR